MARSDTRPIMRSTSGTGFIYVTRKNKVNSREGLELNKYDPVVQRHVVFREERCGQR